MSVTTYGTFYNRQGLKAHWQSKVYAVLRTIDELIDHKLVVLMVCFRAFERIVYAKAQGRDFGFDSRNIMTCTPMYSRRS